MDINKLRHKITIEENKGTVNDGGGNKTPLWEPIASDIWANVRAVSGNEINIASKNIQELTHVVTIRYKTGIKKDKHRVNFRGRILKIEYVINKDELNIELILQCKEV